MIPRPSRRRFLQSLAASSVMVASPALGRLAWTIQGAERGVPRPG